MLSFGCCRVARENPINYRPREANSYRKLKAQGNGKQAAPPTTKSWSWRGGGEIRPTPEEATIVMALLAPGLLAGSPHHGHRHRCGHVLHPQVGLRWVLLLRRPLRLSAPGDIETSTEMAEFITHWTSTNLKQLGLRKQLFYI